MRSLWISNFLLSHVEWRFRLLSPIFYFMAGAGSRFNLLVFCFLCNSFCSYTVKKAALTMHRFVHLAFTAFEADVDLE
jgi:hypothetical protein